MPLSDRGQEVQLRYPCTLSSQEYVATKAWQDATLSACPVHGAGCRTFSRHGTYERYTPWGTAKITRYDCRDARQTFSLLPDCFAAHLTGTLEDLEAEVVQAERKGVAVAVAAIPPRAGGSGPADARDAAVRRLQIRVALVLRALTAIRGLYPEMFGACQPTLLLMRSACGLQPLLLSLRRMDGMRLESVPAPIGFDRVSGRTSPHRGIQHSSTRDPPV